jgi:catechol 2,3-dioxygenase-like lactoylglutathione lyase family enzyme
MAIIGLQHIGIVVKDFEKSCRQFERCFGLVPRDFRDDQGKGMQYDSRVLLGNDCWIHIVHNWNPDSRVYRFHDEYGEGLEHIAVLTNDIEKDVEHLRSLGVPIFEDIIHNAADGFEAFVYPEDGIGFTVELIQPHPTSWTYPEDALGKAVSNRLGVTRLHHICAVVGDVSAAADRFAKLFRLQGEPVGEAAGACIQEGYRIPFGNDCWLYMVESSHSISGTLDLGRKMATGLEHIALETADVEQDAGELYFEEGIQIFIGDQNRAFATPDDHLGFPIELIR